LTIKMKYQESLTAHLPHYDDFNFIVRMTMQMSSINDLRSGNGRGSDHDWCALTGGTSTYS
jgi:hypothetical protein